MKKATTISPFYREIRPGKWKFGIDIQPISGPRKRLTFDTEEERDQELRTLRQEQRRFGNLFPLSGYERAELTKLYLEAKAGGFTLQRAVDFYVAHGKPAESMKLKTAFDEFMVEKERMRLSKDAIQALRSNVGRFVQGRVAMTLAQVQRGDIIGWLKNPDWAPRTYNSYLISLKTFFNWCTGSEKLTKSPAATIQLIGKKQMPDLDEPPTVLDFRQCKRLLLAALEIDRGLIPIIVTGMFAGLRPEKEAGKLLRDDIDAKLILVRGMNAKDGQRRHVDVHPTLLAWLKLAVRSKANFPPKNLRKRFDRVKARAGLVKMTYVPGGDGRYLVEWTGWDQDCLRHTFASHYLPLHSAEKTINQLGHGDYNMLFTHYRKLVSKAEAEKFWNELHPARIIVGLFEPRPSSSTQTPTR